MFDIEKIKNDFCENAKCSSTSDVHAEISYPCSPWAETKATVRGLFVQS